MEHGGEESSGFSGISQARKSTAHHSSSLSCFISFLSAQTETVQPRSKEAQRAAGLSMTGIRSSRVHRPRKINTPARIRSISTARSSLFFIPAECAGKRPEFKDSSIGESCPFGKGQPLNIKSRVFGVQIQACQSAGRSLASRIRIFSNSKGRIICFYRQLPWHHLRGATAERLSRHRDLQSAGSYSWSPSFIL